MPLTEDVIRLILETRGQDAVKELRNEIALADHAARDLSAQWQRGEITTEQYTRQAGKLGRQMAENRANLEALEAAQQGVTASTNQAVEATQRLDTSMIKASGAVGRRGGFGMAVLEGSRALEDLQYGIGGVVNNIPGLVLAMGGTMGIAGVVSVVSVGVNQLVKHWDDLRKMFVGPEVETAAEHLERLEKATKRTAEETAELNRLKKEQADLDRILSLPSEQEEARKKAFTEIGAGVGGGPGVQRALEAALKEFYSHQPGSPFAGEGAEATAARHADVLKIMRGIGGGDVRAVQAIEEILSGAPKARGGAFGQAFEGALPGLLHPRTRAQEEAEQKRRKDQEEADKNRKEFNDRRKKADEQYTEDILEWVTSGDKQRKQSLKTEGDNNKKFSEESAQAQKKQADEQEKQDAEASKALEPFLGGIESRIAREREQFRMTRGREMGPRERAEQEAGIERDIYKQLGAQGMDLGQAALVSQRGYDIALRDINSQITDAQGAGITAREATIQVLTQLIQNQETLAAAERQQAATLRQLHTRSQTALNQGSQ